MKTESTYYSTYINMKNTSKMFLINYQIPDYIKTFYKNAAEEFKSDFVIQPDNLRKYVSLQLKKDKPYYKDDWFKEMKTDIAKIIGLDESEYVRVRDSIGVNEAGVGITPHRDDIWPEVIDMSDVEHNEYKQSILKTFFTENVPGIGLWHKNSSLVQMRCNFFVVDPQGGQNPWVEDSILNLPSAEWGVGFDSAYIHGTTPGNNKKITLSMGFLIRLETFNRLVYNNYYDFQTLVTPNPYYKLEDKNRGILNPDFKYKNE